MLERAIERRFCDRVRNLEAKDLVLGLDFLSTHEHALIPIGELSFWESFADRRLEIEIPDIDPDSLAGQRTHQVFDLLHPAFHPDLFAKICARPDLIRCEPGHTLAAMLVVHRPEDRITT